MTAIFTFIGLFVLAGLLAWYGGKRNPTKAV